MIQFWWSSSVVSDLVNVSKFQNIRSCNMGIYYNLVTMMNYEQLHYTDLCDLVRRASRNKPFICLGEVLEMEIREEPAHWSVQKRLETLRNSKKGVIRWRPWWKLILLISLPASNFSQSEIAGCPKHSWTRFPSSNQHLTLSNIYVYVYIQQSSNWKSCFQCILYTL